MAEFAASIIGIVSAGTKVALVLSQLSADVGSAGHEARMIGGEIRSFCSVLKTLGETIEQIEASPRYAHCSEMIKDMTEDSLQMFTEILNAVDKLKKMTQGREGKDGNFGLVERVQWAVLKKPKLLVLRAAIEAYKTNLTLMLSTLSTAEKATRRASSIDDAAAVAQDRQDRSLLQSLELDREATLIELAAAERLYEEARSPNVIDVALSSNPPAYNAVVTDIDREDTGLLDSARNEICAIRSSLPKTAVIDVEALEAKIVRHSRRISRMLENDKERLTQRWSLTLEGSASNLSKDSPTTLLHPVSDGRPPMHHMAVGSHLPQTNLVTTTTLSHHDGSKSGSSFDPRVLTQYKTFISWLVQFEAPSRRKIVRALREDVRQLEGQAPNKSAISVEMIEVALPVKSTPRLLSSHKSSNSLSTTISDQQSHISRSNSRKNRKVVALPALQYVQPSTTGSSFLLDQSRRPPGRKPSPARSTTQYEGMRRPLGRFHTEPSSPASINTVSSAVSTSRQEALARLVGTDQSTPASLPQFSFDSNKAPLPKIQISKHRRSRSEHTLNVGKLTIPSPDHGTSRSRSVHDLRHKEEVVRAGGTRVSVSDLSEDGSDDEGASMWWKSLGNISPQPF